MAARAIWKGVLQAAELQVPVKLYSAIEDRDVHFNLLHDEDKVPLKQRMVNPVTNQTVPAESVRKGYPIEPGTFVLLRPEELDELEPPPSRSIEILRFVPAGHIGHAWYERPYYLGPDEGGSSAYAALAAALAERQREGVARWVMRNKEYAGAVRAQDGHLVLMTLRNAEEVVPAAELETPAGRQLEPKERAMAEQLVTALEDRFDPAAYRDEYRDRVLKLVESKAAGRPLKLKAAPKPPAPSRSLTSVLEASLKAVKEKARAR